MKFDMTPLFSQGSNKIILRLAVCSLPLVVLVLAAGYREFAVSLFRGVVLGLLDTLIMFAGIKKALPYVHEPSKGLAVMRRFRWYRLLSASLAIVLMLKLKFQVLGVVFGFLLIHIFLIFNLIFIAYRLDKEET